MLARSCCLLTPAVSLTTRSGFCMLVLGQSSTAVSSTCFLSRPFVLLLICCVSLPLLAFSQLSASLSYSLLSSFFFHLTPTVVRTSTTSHLALHNPFLFHLSFHKKISQTNRSNLIQPSFVSLQTLNHSGFETTDLSFSLFPFRFLLTPPGLSSDTTNVLSD